MGKVNIINHPLIVHKLTLMRCKETPPKEFRELLHEISMLMAYEVTRDMPLKEIEIETPMQSTTAQVLSGKMMAVVPILRAGLGMVDGILEIVPAAKVGHIGLYRDEKTHMPVEYYCKIPVDSDKREMLVVDPMLATGGSAAAAITFLKERGCNRIRLMCLLGTDRGIKTVQDAHPDVDIFIAAVDPEMDENCYIRPGLGDAGDRMYGTK